MSNFWGHCACVFFICCLWAVNGPCFVLACPWVSGLHTESGYPHESIQCPHNLAFVLTLVWSRAVFVSSLWPVCMHFQGDISLPCLLLCFLLSLKFSSVILAFFQVNENRGPRDWCVWIGGVDRGKWLRNKAVSSLYHYILLPICFLFQVS